MSRKKKIALFAGIPVVLAASACKTLAWRMTKEPIAADEVRKAQSHAGRQAADARHASNRAAKQKALELFASNTYRTKEEAYRIIGAQVCKAPGTIKNWIAGLQKNTPPE